MQKVGKNPWGEQIVDPVCTNPNCDADNIRNIVYQDGINPDVPKHDNPKSPFTIVYCGKCGHVYGIIPSQ